MSHQVPRTSQLRRLPLPSTDPPFDDELGLLPRPVRRRHSYLVRSGHAPASSSSEAAPSAAPSGQPARRGNHTSQPVAALPDPRRWCARVTQALVEAAFGNRPLQQLLGWTSTEVYRVLTTIVSRGTRAAPVAAPTVRSIRVCQVSPGVVEAAAVLQARNRVRALALRLEAAGGRWVCTAFELV